MQIKSFFKYLLFVLLLSFISCDKDFNEIGTDIVGGDNDHYNMTRYTDATVKAYNQKIGPVATNNLPINPLGIYSNPGFGTMTANFVTQLELSTTSPTFNNTDTDNYQTLPVVDSVILNIPYFSRVLDTDDEGKKTYQLDSIYGQNQSKFKLSVYRSNYFLRDLDPDQQLGEQQLFYNDNTGVDANYDPIALNSSANTAENTQFFFDPREHKTTITDEEGNVDDTRFAPSMRLHLDTNYFNQAIINAPSSQLESNALFKNYFRGLYFKVESLGNEGNMAMINFKGGTITMYYKEDKKTTTDNVDTFTRVDKTLVMKLSGNTVSLQSYNDDSNYSAGANNPNEAEKLYLKGGQGSVAVIDLFGSVDTKGYEDNPTYNENLPISNTNPKYILTGPNGVSDEIDDMKYNGWMINEANLTFYVDKTYMSNTKTIEPNRLFLYDITNNKVLIDYTVDLSTNSSYPKYGKVVHSGMLLNDDNTITKQIKDEDGVITNKGGKYKIRLTNHIRNLINKDSTNVRLGLAITENINTVSFSKIKTPVSTTNKLPIMTVLSPLGTVLYGTSSNVPEAQRLKLEIYYTKPNQN